MATSGGLDAELLRVWLLGWTLTRGTPPPVEVRGGFRVDVGWPDQRVRYVFPEITPDVADLARRIRHPWVFIKVAASSAALLRIAPPPWTLQEERCVMSLDAEMPTHPLPRDYHIDIKMDGPVTLAEVHDTSGDCVARGGLVCVEGRAIYDRIETAAGHRRQGFASAIMGVLAARARAAGVTRGLLVATSAGRPLYERLGWRAEAPYATAVIPGP